MYFVAGDSSSGRQDVVAYESFPGRLDSAALARFFNALMATPNGIFPIALYTGI